MSLGAILCLCIGLALAPRWASAGPWDAQIESLRHAMATDPQRSLDMAENLRQSAARAGDLLAGLRIDEIECRVQNDLDNSRAITVAEAGLRRLPADPPPALQDAWMRLRACHAGSLLQMERRPDGEKTLAELIATAPPGSSAWAIAHIERGVDRTRHSDPVGAQEDLIAACDALRRLGDRRDIDLCLSQLANHYRRIGDAEEAQRLLVGLLASAHRAGEHYDASIYAYNLSHVLAAQQRWDDALGSALEAEQASIRLNDRLGQGYAGRVIALALMHQGKIGEALTRMGLALNQVDEEADERELTHGRLLHAELLARAGRPAEALQGLDVLRTTVDKRQEKEMWRAWHGARALALAGLGRWREAYEARLAELGVVEDIHQRRLSEQAARMGKQFHRAQDAQELAVMRQLADRERQLRQTQALALGLFALLLGAVVVLVVRKIRQVRRLQRLASTDELTGLMNRRALMEHAAMQLERARQRAEPLAMLMVDIDHFKRINDEHGHPVGDRVLRHAASALLSALRTGDRLGRIGGEEFVAVLAQAGPDDARRAAERMRQAVEDQPLLLDGGALRFTVSIGLAVRHDGDGVDELLQRADTALYRAKSAGRNQVAD